MSDKKTANGGTVLLIGFYNTKALGLRYLENALELAGYNVRVLFFKSFNSVSPKPATAEEMALLKKFVAETQPVLIGLSVMASLYLDTVKAVSSELRGGVPVLWGGVYPTMFPAESMEHADYV
ncbi:MAG: cobalamin B12-binding domain-containing protein, partial [Oscillospiraceae bacterium]|nr:cobalamin B12-binding domain-containing protein [Oscillospiraceae bacterium]